MPTADEIIATLRAHEAELRAAGIERLSLFGSVARDEAGPDSDVDLLAQIDRQKATSCWARYSVHDDLESILGRNVDLLTEPIRRERLMRNIAPDLRLVF